MRSQRIPFLRTKIAHVICMFGVGLRDSCRKPCRKIATDTSFREVQEQEQEQEQDI